MTEFADIEKADIYVFVFPHLSEFLVLDTRPQPEARHLQAGEVLAEEFFREVEGDFSQLLREKGSPLLNLMSLPQRTESLLQEKGLAFILRNLRPFEGPPLRASILLAGGPILSLPEPALSEMLRTMLGPEADEATIDSGLGTLHSLIARERESAQQADTESLRDTIQGRSPNFFTLWERQG